MNQSTEDRFGIGYLLVRYATALDNGDIDGIAGCFTEDEPCHRRVFGPRRHSRVFERFAALNKRGAQLRHVLSNLAMTVDGDAAWATCQLTNIVTVDGESQTRGNRPALAGARVRANRWRMVA